MEIEQGINVADFQKLHYELEWKVLDDKSVQASINNSMFVVRAEIDGQVVGMARLVGDGETHGLINDVIVLPKYQGQGIGKKLVTTLLELTQELVNTKDEFLIELLPAHGKQEFYKKCGFKHKPENMDGMYLWIKNQNIYNKDTKKHALRLNPEPFESIKNGMKTVEMRLYDEKRQQIKEGDVIMFINRENFETLRTKVLKLHKFDSFKDLYQAFDKKVLGYKPNEEAKSEDMTKYYSIEEQSKYGVVGIEIKLI